MIFQRIAFAQRLNTALAASSMNQRQVADRLHVSPNRVNEWACGRGVPKLHQVVAIAALLDVTLDWLLTGHHDVNPAERRLVDDLAQLAPSLTRLAARAERLARN